MHDEVPECTIPVGGGVPDVYSGAPEGSLKTYEFSFSNSPAV